MSLRRKIYQPLPFYSSIQETHYKNRCEACHNSFIYNTENLPSFVLERDHDYLNSNFLIELIDYKTGAVVQTITTSYTPKIVTFTDQEGNLKDQILFNNAPVNQLPCGTYRIKVTDYAGGNEWYSEIYKIEQVDTLNLTHNKITWRNSCTLNEVMYDSYPEFEFGVYFEDISNVCEPDYTFEREVQRNNLGEEREVLKSMIKYYRLDTGLIPEFLVDALGVMRISDTVKIYPKGENVLSYENCIQEVTTSEPTWDSLGCSSNIEIRFRRDESLVSTGCCLTDRFICPDTSYIVNRGINQSVAFLEDPGTLTVGDAWHVNSTANPLMVSSNVPCITIEEGNEQVDKIWVWNGTCFDFIDLVEYITFYDPITLEPCTGVYLINQYKPLPNITIVDKGGGNADLFVQFIPEGFYATVSERMNDTLGLFDLVGIYTKTEIENGISLSGGAGNTWYYKVEVKNYNCDLGTKTEEFVYS